MEKLLDDRSSMESFKLGASRSNERKREHNKGNDHGNKRNYKDSMGDV